MGLFSRKKRRILVTDDDPTVRLILRRALSRSEFDVDEAKNGAQCVEMVNGTGCDLLILDYKMPHMDGMQVLRKLADLPHEKRIPVLMLTGESDVGAVSKAYEYNVIDYVLKPFDAGAVVDKVVGFLNREKGK